MEKLFGLLLLIMLAPALLCALVQVLCCLMQITVSTLAVLLPWVLLFGLVIALGAGIGAGARRRVGVGAIGPGVDGV